MASREAEELHIDVSGDRVEMKANRSVSIKRIVGGVWKR